jgi:hypothetical protein
MKSKLLVLVFALFIFGCAHDPGMVVLMNTETIFEALLETEGSWMEGVLPKGKWPKEVRHLNPLRVYSDRINAVIVLYDGKYFEHGVYVCMPGTSFLPADGDGWEFENIGEFVYSYRRKKVPSADIEEA